MHYKFLADLYFFPQSYLDSEGFFQEAATLEDEDSTPHWKIQLKALEKRLEELDETQRSLHLCDMNRIVEGHSSLVYTQEPTEKSNPRGRPKINKNSTKRDLSLFEIKEQEKIEKDKKAESSSKRIRPVRTAAQISAPTKPSLKGCYICFDEKHIAKNCPQQVVSSSFFQFIFHTDIYFILTGCDVGRPS